MRASRLGRAWRRSWGCEPAGPTRRLGLLFRAGPPQIIPEPGRSYFTRIASISSSRPGCGASGWKSLSPVSASTTASRTREGIRVGVQLEELLERKPRPLPAGLRPLQRVADRLRDHDAAALRQTERLLDHGSSPPSPGSRYRVPDLEGHQGRLRDRLPEVHVDHAGTLERLADAVEERDERFFELLVLVRSRSPARRSGRARAAALPPRPSRRPRCTRG